MTSKLNARLVSALLVLIMLAAAFASCAETPNTDDLAQTTDSADSPAATTIPEETTKEIITDDVPELNFGGEDFIILARNRDWVADEVVVDSENGTIINDAVYKRNLLVEKRLGVKIVLSPIEGTDNYAVVNKLEMLIKGGSSDEVDLVVNAAYVGASTTTRGVYYNLNEVPNLDLSKPYWSQGLNESISFGDAQYICSGAALLSYYRFIFVTFFNINMFSDLKLTPIYDLVESKEWTLDKQFELTEAIYSDNGDGVTGEGDIFGFVSNHNMIGVDAYWSSCNLPLLVHNADGQYEYAMDIERTVRAMDLINKLFWDNRGTYRVDHITGDLEQDTIAQIFASGNAGMATLRLIEVENDLTQMSDDYGIVPIPILESTQEKYSSSIHNSFSSYSVPNINKTEAELEMIGAVLEVLGSQSFNTITPAYYEQALKGRYAKDPQSLQMLDLITQNVEIDAGVLYCNSVDKPNNTIRDVIGKHNTAATSLLTAKKVSVTRKVAALNEDLEKLFN